MAGDVTVANTFAASYLDSSYRHFSWSAAERATTLKTNKYQHLQNNYIFVPLACEVMGSWSHDQVHGSALNFLTVFPKNHHDNW